MLLPTDHTFFRGQFNSVIKAAQIPPGRMICILKPHLGGPFLKSDTTLNHFSFCPVLKERQTRSTQLTGVHLEPGRILCFWMHSLWPRCCIHPCLQNIPQTTMADTELLAVSVDTLLGCIFPHLHKYFILFCLCKKLNMLIWKLEKKIFFHLRLPQFKSALLFIFLIHSLLKIKTTYLNRIAIILVIFKTVKNKIKLDIFQSYFFNVITNIKLIGPLSVCIYVLNFLLLFLSRLSFQNLLFAMHFILDADLFCCIIFWFSIFLQQEGKI